MSDNQNDVAAKQAEALRNAAAKDKAAQSNAKANGGAIIDAMLAASQQVDNAELRMVEFMFGSEVSYSKGWCLQVLNAKGADKTALIDKTLSDLSDTVKNMIADRAVITEKKAALHTNNEKQRLIVIDRKLKAARQMITRAVYSVYGLRVNEATIVRFEASKGALKIQTAAMKSVDESERELLTRGAAEKAGRDLFGAGNSRKAKSNSAPVSPEAGLKEMMALVEKHIRTVPDFSNLSDDLHDAATSLLSALMLRQFSADGLIEVKDLKAFAVDTIKVRVA